MGKISIKYGLVMLVGFISFFLLMYVLGFGHRTEFRIFNGVIHLFCIHQAILAYYKTFPENIGNYMKGVAQGMGASAVAVVGYILFLMFFLLGEKDLMTTIRQNSNIPSYLNFFTICLYILVEGIVVSLIGSYILMRIVDNNIKKEAFKQE